uniref:C-type lectin domain family 17, member A-like n=1 Tax=Saccoglossus kowalevskii TaxID=10224 RepID=A0ABM0MJ93_SACKO|nr:PREDICTED: C-type lectin domain family 17, member A-like [Saccoglossus kowalevskii]
MASKYIFINEIDLLETQKRTSTMLKLIAALVLVGVVSGTCPDTFTPWEGNCYRAVAADAEWDEGEGYCFLYGGHLTSLHSIEEERFAKQLAGPNEFWIGLSTSDNSGWRWSDGTPMDYQNWGDDQPSDGMFMYDEDCVTTNDDSRRIDYQWNDVNCNRERHFVCKAPLIA